LSPTSGASDIKLDAVAVVAGPALALTPDQVGQVEPGSSVVYTHQLANTGNVPLSNVLPSGTPDAASDDGWSVVLYEDSNGDGVWGPTDTVIGDGVALQTAGADGVLDVGESLAIFSKVFAPASVAFGITNVKTLTANAEGASQSVSDSATDTTTTNNTDVAMSIQKKKKTKIKMLWFLFLLEKKKLLITKNFLTKTKKLRKNQKNGTKKKNQIKILKRKKRFLKFKLLRNWFFNKRENNWPLK